MSTLLNRISGKKLGEREIFKTAQKDKAWVTKSFDTYETNTEMGLFKLIDTPGTNDDDLALMEWVNLAKEKATLIDLALVCFSTPNFEMSNKSDKDWLTVVEAIKYTGLKDIAVVFTMCDKGTTLGEGGNMDK